MSRLLHFGLGVIALGLSAAGWRLTQSPADALFEPSQRPPETAPLCPWREPAADLERFFPTATRYHLETRILSGSRVELADRLGRPMTGEENTLQLFQVWHGEEPLGSVMTRRVKGEHGAIEIVLAVTPNGMVRGLRLQRLREPEAIAEALQSAAWLEAFAGRGVSSSWRLGADLPSVPPKARISAEAVVEGVRAKLILLAAAEQALEQSSSAHSHH